jgi:translocation and assembly module TamA
MRVFRYFQISFIGLILLGTGVSADELEYTVSGVTDSLQTNVFGHVSRFRIGSGANLNGRLRRKIIEDAKIAATKAMRPFGYFHPVISVEMHSTEAGKWVVEVDVKTGPPVLVQNLQLALTGPGRELKALLDWYKAFPLIEGEILNQQAWDKAKQDALDLLEEEGYLQPNFIRHIIRVNPVANTARLELELDTGPQATLGNVTFKQEILSDGVLTRLQRFEYGDVYNSWLLEKFRLDLWRSGYFEDVEVVERRDLSAVPPRVDLEVNTQPRMKNTYQSTFGFGTDTLIRLQFRWSRHLLSPRGDNFDIGFGWQQKDNEFTFQANYRLPRKTQTRQFWMANLGLKSEKQDLLVSESNDQENRYAIARGTINDNSLRLGRTRVRNMRGGYQQFFESIYAQYLNETHDFEPSGKAPEELSHLDRDGSIGSQINSTSNSLSFGMDWDWPEIRGSGFETVGHHERAWLFTSNDAWGSDDDFSQIYLSSRWNFLAGNRWKFLFRAEAGYSKAKTTDVILPTDDVSLDISTGDLPYLYRFKAGGSRSVRGYAFEVLDSNGLGSNNILTASAEAEYRFRDNWSLATFVDIGNAFNDWSDPDLKTGTGIGVRWYSIIGAVRLDVAKGWALEGEPWRIHLTIGTPLL